ncbi:MAG: CaiB/BaiF CoA-transferase family protein [Chloroflexi bacterium]|nr:CaiB/BaiF CoA-transferase family protein [Chloroflexota bacterium]
MASALSGIRVLDLSGMGPASLAAMILGDMGAEIIKIDLPPGGGSRGVGDGLVYMPEDKFEAAKMAANSSNNRNKRNVALNLRMEAGQRVFHKLAEKADIVLESFRPGVMDKMNVGYQALSKTNPRIIYCAVSGYGQTGPYRSFPGHDANYAAMGGVQALIGESKDGAPVFALNIVADMAIAVLQATVGMLLAVCARERTGHGQLVDISMTDGVVQLLAGIPGPVEYFYSGVVPQRGDTMTSGTLPYYSVYQTKDNKWLTVCPIEPRFWGNMCRAIGRDDLIPHQFDPKKKDEMLVQLRKVFASRTRDEWFDYLTKADVPVGKVLEIDELFRDPQVLHRQMVIERSDPKFGKVRQIGFGIKLSDTPGTIRGLGGLLGRDTDEVLSSFGYSQSQMKELREQGVIYQEPVI